MARLQAVLGQTCARRKFFFDPMGGIHEAHSTTPPRIAPSAFDQALLSPFIIQS
jgi:hypothetical protein